MVHFDICQLNNDGSGDGFDVLIAVRWPAIPRIGDLLSLCAPQFGNAGESRNIPVEFIVDEVIWEFYTENSEHPSDEPDIRVLVHRRQDSIENGFRLFCVCVQSFHEDEDGKCENCGRKAQP